MILKLNLYIKEVLLFGFALFLGIFSANRLPGYSNFGSKPGNFELSDFVAMFIFLVLLLIFRKNKKFIGLSFKLLLILLILGGSEIIFGVLVPFPFDLMASLLLLAGYLFYRNVLIHNLAIIVGIAGLSAVIGLSITPKFVIFMLVLLSFYDIIAVYKTKHMIRMAKSMMQSGAIFGFVIPSSFKGFISNKDDASKKISRPDTAGQTAAVSDFMILGSGDIGLPLIMACSLVAMSLSASIITALFSLAGLFLTHLIFVNQKEKKPMAALPPIATMTIIGYIVTQLIL